MVGCCQRFPTSPGNAKPTDRLGPFGEPDLAICVEVSVSGGGRERGPVDSKKSRDQRTGRIAGYDALLGKGHSVGEVHPADRLNEAQLGSKLVAERDISEAPRRRLGEPLSDFKDGIRARGV